MYYLTLILQVISWFDIFLVLVRNTSYQKIPVKLKVLNSSLYSMVYSMFNFTLKPFYPHYNI